MDPTFWLQRWEEDQIGFHKSEANPILLNYFGELDLAKDSRIFVPLCGKTLDIAWLLAQGYRVAGAELSEIAIQQLFAELGVDPQITERGQTKHYQAEGIDIFVGDIFQLSRDMLGPVDAIYDSAALVALPAEMRQKYAVHLVGITANAPQLLICFEYDQSLKNGPPFSVTPEMVEQQYNHTYQIRAIENAELAGGLRDNTPAKRSVWLLQKS